MPRIPVVLDTLGGLVISRNMVPLTERVTLDEVDADLVEEALEELRTLIDHRGSVAAAEHAAFWAAGERFYVRARRLFLGAELLDPRHGVWSAIWTTAGGEPGISVLSDPIEELARSRRLRCCFPFARVAHAQIASLLGQKLAIDEPLARALSSVPYGWADRDFRRRFRESRHCDLAPDWIRLRVLWHAFSVEFAEYMRTATADGVTLEPLDYCACRWLVDRWGIDPAVFLVRQTARSDCIYRGMPKAEIHELLRRMRTMTVMLSIDEALATGLRKMLRPA